MARLQHYEGRLYDREEILQVLACQYGVVTVLEIKKRATLRHAILTRCPLEIRRVADMLGIRPIRYWRTWERRSLVACLRAGRGVSSSSGLGYGPDWKGKLIFLNGIRLHTIRTCHPIKSVVKEYEEKHRVPLAVMRNICSVIIRRDEEAWNEYSLKIQRK